MDTGFLIAEKLDEGLPAVEMLYADFQTNRVTKKTFPGATNYHDILLLTH